MRKKVIFVVTKSNFGGAQRYVYDLATHLPDAYEPVVAFGPPPGGGEGRLAKLFREKGIRTVLIESLSRDVSLVDDYQALKDLTRLFKTEKPTVVHLNSSKAGGLGALAARLARVPRIIFTSHGLPYDEDRNAFQRILIIIATWLTIILTHCTIFISSDTIKRVNRLPLLHRRTKLIYNGIESPAFFAPAEARKALATIDPRITSTMRIVGCIGELHPNKNSAVLIDACARQADVHLVLIGDGELRSSLEQQAKESGSSERVHFLGYVPDAARYLRAFDIFALSSLKEGLPYVLLEAGFAYVPVVASDIPGIRDVILPDFTGILAQPRDAQSFANGISRILNDATLARSLSDELLLRMRKTFSFDTMVEKTVALY